MRRERRPSGFLPSKIQNDFARVTRCVTRRLKKE